MQFNESHTSVNISKKLLTVLDEWEITDKIHIAVRDNASNMVCAFNESQIDSAGCLAHSLQLGPAKMNECPMCLENFPTFSDHRVIEIFLFETLCGDPFI